MADAHQEEYNPQDIVNSTVAIVFMGTPHRGSEDMAAWGEKGRKIASALLMDSNSSLLDALGLKMAILRDAMTASPGCRKEKVSVQNIPGRTCAIRSQAWTSD